MKARIFWLSIILTLALMAGCSSNDPTATPKIEPTTVSETTSQTAANSENTAPAPVVLELVNDSETQSLTMDDLKTMPAVEGWGGSKSSTGRITPPEIHKGVTLQELCQQIGGLEPGTGVNIVAKDGYAIDAPLQVIVAYERSGEPIPEDADGPLRLAIISAKNNQVVDGHWTVKWVTGIAIKLMTEDWTLGLEGMLSKEMDRATFESCGANNCHQLTWTDDDGHTWSGVPLWMMAARVDDENRHGDDAYLDV